MDARELKDKSPKLSELKYFYWSFLPVALMVFIHFLNALINVELRSYGIVPRTFVGLRGVFFSPFLHGDFAHLAGNLMPLWVLLFVLAFFYGAMFWLVMPFVLLLSGFITWCIGSGGAVHIGASGLVFGLAIFIAISGFLRRDVVLVAVAIFIGFSYQFLGAGLIPVGDNVSYSSHYAGLVSGILASFLFIKIKSRTQAWKLKR